MLIPLQVTFRNMEHSTELEDLVRNEAAKLERFYDRIASCRVILERPQRANSSHLHHIRIDLSLPNGELVVKHLPGLHGTLRDLETDRSRREADSTLVQKKPALAIREAFHEMRRRVQDYAREQAGYVKTLRKQPVAEVEQIFPADGYGFLKTVDGHQIYFNQASVLDGHFNRLRVGARVRFDEEAGEKGPQASTVKLMHPRKQAQSAASVVPLARKKAAARPE